MFDVYLLLALLQSAGSPSPPPPAQPSTQAAQPSAPAAQDPARLTFPAGATGLVLVLVRADRTADYEAVLTAIREHATKAPAEEQALTAGWQIFKAREADPKGNIVYVHWLPTPQPETDYRPSFVLDRLAATLDEGVLAKYRDAIAGGPMRLTLDRLLDLGLTPLPPPRVR